MVNIKLDLKDKRILYELEKNARQSNKEIAKKLGLNVDLVRYRINNLEKEGLIAWHLTFVNFSKLGYTDYGVYFNTHNLTKNKEAFLIEYLSKHNKISYFARLGGKYDFMFGLLATDILDFENLLSGILNQIGQYISNRDIAIRVALFHFPKSYLIDTKEIIGKMPSFGGKIEKIELDEIDKKIIKEMSINARININDLSNKIKVPASTISLRLKKLQKNKIIEGFFTFTRPQAYGYQNNIITISFNNLSKENESIFYGFCKQHPNVVYLIKTVGKWDYELSVEFPDQERFQELLSELREKFHASISNMEFVTIFKDIKYSLYPF